MTVAFVGLQHPHSLAIYLSLQQIVDIERLIVVEPDATFREKVEATARYASLDELFAQERPHACFVLHPTDEAPALALRCIRQGCHVFIDKHCANSSAALLAVVTAAREHHVQFSAGYLWRQHPITRDIRRLVHEGMLGEVWAWELRMVTTSIAARRAGAATMQGAVRPVGGSPWLFEQSRSGGGILMWLACHYLDWIFHVLGTQVVEVSALTAKRTQEAVDVEDVASVSVRMDDGALGTIHAGYITPGGFAQKDDTYLSLQGTQGDVRWTPVAQPPHMTVRSAHPEWRGAHERVFHYALSEAPGYGGGIGLDFFRGVIADFRANRPPLVSARDAVQVLRVFEAAYESARSGRVVRVTGDE